MAGNNGDMVDIAPQAVPAAYGRINLPQGAAASFTERNPALNGAAVNDYCTALDEEPATDRDNAFEHRLLAAINASAAQLTAAINASEGRVRGDVTALSLQQQASDAKLRNNTSRSFGLDELVQVPTLAKLPDGTLRAKPAVPASGLVSVNIVDKLTRRQLHHWLEYYGRATSDDEHRDRLNLRIELGAAGHATLKTV